MAALLLTLLGGPVVVAAGGGGETPPAPPTSGPAAAPAGTGNALTLAGGEVSLTYPDALALAVTEDQLLTRSVIPVCGEEFGYCLYLPAGEFAGSNLSAAGLRVSARDDLTAEVSCLLAQPAGWSELQPGVLRGSPASTARFGDLSEGAAGSYGRGDVLRLWTGESCYEFESRLVLTRIENYEPGAVTEFTADDQAALLEAFGAVLASVTLADGTEVTWPAAPRSTLEAFVRVDTPAAGASVASPLRVSGDAVGPWFFEGTFPLELVGEGGEVLATGYVIAAGHWMTTDFVAFSGELEFEVEAPTEATLVLRRDNPSDLPQHDASVRVPLVLLPE